MSAHTVHYGPLTEGGYYHVYNRGNNGDNLFYTPENYRYFLILLDHHIGTYLDIFAYCLLPNHFHILIRVKEFDTLPEAARILRRGNSSLSSAEEIVSEAFRRFFIAYAQAIKKQENRTGSLFEKNFRRKRVESERYFSNLITYIHRNPQTHGICSDFREYPHSSYERILVPRQTKLQKHLVLEWFGGSEHYRAAHEKEHDYETIRHLSIEG